MCRRPIDRTEVKEDSGYPENTVGKLIIKGVNTMLGYYKNEVLSVFCISNSETR